MPFSITVMLNVLSVCLENRAHACIRLSEIVTNHVKSELLKSNLPRTSFLFCHLFRRQRLFVHMQECVCQTAGTLTLFSKLFPSWILFLAPDEAKFPIDSATQCK